MKEIAIVIPPADMVFREFTFPTALLSLMERPNITAPINSPKAPTRLVHFPINESIELNSAFAFASEYTDGMLNTDKSRIAETIINPEIIIRTDCNCSFASSFLIDSANFIAPINATILPILAIQVPKKFNPTCAISAGEPLGGTGSIVNTFNISKI